MPLITDEPIENIDPKVSYLIPGWLFEYKRLGYQFIKDEVFIYKLPTFQQCILYHKASAHHSMSAGREFLNRLGLTPVPKRARPSDVAQLITGILNENFLSNDKEKSVLADIKWEKASYTVLLIKALEPHVKFLGIDKSIWDMTYPELVEALALKELVSGESIEDKKKSRTRIRRPREATGVHPGQPGSVQGGPQESDGPFEGGEVGSREGVGTGREAAQATTRKS